MREGVTASAINNRRADVIRELDARNMAHAVRQAFKWWFLTAPTEVEGEVWISGLTPIELHELDLASRGYYASESAEIRGATLSSSLNARNRILRRLVVGTMAEAVRIGFETSILSQSFAYNPY